MEKLSNIPVLVLCGGNKVYIDSSESKPKCLVSINGKTILSRIIEHYHKFGFTKFIFSMGADSNLITDEVNSWSHLNIESKFVESGDSSLTGTRILKAKNFLVGNENFAMTYSDTLSDINLKEVYDFHLEENRIVTLTATHLPVRFRVLGMRAGEDCVRGFADTPVIENDWINGGFYFLNKKYFQNEKYTDQSNDFAFETFSLEHLSEDSELMAFKFKGFWQHLDSKRDLINLEKRYEN